MGCPACQGPTVLEAIATGHAMSALRTAEKLRLNYCEAADGETPSSTGSGTASQGSSQSSSRESACASSKQSVKDQKGADNEEDTWQDCLEHAHAAAKAWQACLDAGVVGGRDGMADADMLSELMLELLFMAGLHGEASSATVTKCLTLIFCVLSMGESLCFN